MTLSDTAPRRWKSYHPKWCFAFPVDYWHILAFPAALRVEALNKMGAAAFSLPKWFYAKAPTPLRELVLPCLVQNAMNTVGFGLPPSNILNAVYIKSQCPTSSLKCQHPKQTN